jgi:hypothetical protein
MNQENLLFRNPKKVNEGFVKIINTGEVITNPESKTIEDFYQFLDKFFKPEEMEPLEVYKDELANKNPEARFILTALRDPDKQNKLVSVAYGSVQNGILAVRFTLTEQSYSAVGLHSTGITEKADDLLLKEAEKFCKEHGEKLFACVCEAVDTSEPYMNSVGLKRLYYPGTDKEVNYELPPLAWNPNGTPAIDGATEHLMVLIDGCNEKVKVSDLEKIFRNWWDKWYIRSREQFESEEAWELHKKTVWDVLEDKILGPIKDVEELTLMTKKERKALEKNSC